MNVTRAVRLRKDVARPATVCFRVVSARMALPFPFPQRSSVARPKIRSEPSARNYYDTIVVVAVNIVRPRVVYRPTDQYRQCSSPPTPRFVDVTLVRVALVSRPSFVEFRVSDALMYVVVTISVAKTADKEIIERTPG